MSKTIMTLTAVAAICLAVSETMLTSCNKIEDLDGMNEKNAYYSYISECHDFDYEVAAGLFDTAIRFSVGLDPILSGADDKVIEACDECYSVLRPKLRGRNGRVRILKIRHPDGKRKILKDYTF